MVKRSAGQLQGGQARKIAALFRHFDIAGAALRHRVSHADLFPAGSQAQASVSLAIRIMHPCPRSTHSFPAQRADARYTELTTAARPRFRFAVLGVVPPIWARGRPAIT